MMKFATFVLTRILRIDSVRAIVTTAWWAGKVQAVCRPFVWAICAGGWMYTGADLLL